MSMVSSFFFALVLFCHICTVVLITSFESSASPKIMVSHILEFFQKPPLGNGVSTIFVSSTSARIQCKQPKSSHGIFRYHCPHQVQLLSYLAKLYLYTLISEIMLQAKLAIVLLEVLLRIHRSNGLLNQHCCSSLFVSIQVHCEYDWRIESHHYLP